MQNGVNGNIYIAVKYFSPFLSQLSHHFLGTDISSSLHYLLLPLFFFFFYPLHRLQDIRWMIWRKGYRQKLS